MYCCEVVNLKGTVVNLKGTVVNLKGTVVNLKGTVGNLKGTVVNQKCSYVNKRLLQFSLKKAKKLLTICNLDSIKFKKRTFLSMVNYLFYSHKPS